MRLYVRMWSKHNTGYNLQPSLTLLHASKMANFEEGENWQKISNFKAVVTNNIFTVKKLLYK